MGTPAPNITSEKHLLITYHGDWADEMDVHGFFLTTQTRWNNYVEGVREHFENNSEHSYYVGTNEEIIYESAEMVLNDYDVKEISSEDAEVIKKYFGKGYGFTGPDF